MGRVAWVLDNGAQIDTIMPKYVSDHSLQMGPITNLLGDKVDRVQGYDKGQIVLVILDLSNFVACIPVILGTPTIS